MKKSGTIIFGRNPVRSALEAEHASLLYVSRRLSNDSLVSLARSKGIEVKIVDDGFLDHLSQNQLHQGFVAEVASYPTISLAEMIAQAKKPYPLIVILDGIEDPHNLGAILRSADAFGVDGVILKSHGFRHPAWALHNALLVYDLNDIEKDIIRNHMFFRMKSVIRRPQNLL